MIFATVCYIANLDDQDGQRELISRVRMFNTEDAAKKHRADFVKRTSTMYSPRCDVIPFESPNEAMDVVRGILVSVAEGLEDRAKELRELAAELPRHTDDGVMTEEEESYLGFQWERAYNYQDPIPVETGRWRKEPQP